jgi:hypothetical protein
MTTHNVHLHRPTQQHLFIIPFIVVQFTNLAHSNWIVFLDPFHHTLEDIFHRIYPGLSTECTSFFHSPVHLAHLIGIMTALTDLLQQSIILDFSASRGSGKQQIGQSP